MRRNLFALVVLLALLATGLEAHAVAVCTAANPNASVIESTPTSAFTDNGNGTVTHTLTGLIWKRCAEGQTWSGATCTGGATTFNWANALIQAKNASFAGQTDWRLPNLKELESIVESCGYSPSINQTLFPATPASYFWSGSSYVPDPAGAWSVDFSVGDTYAFLKSYAYYARLVRGGQSFDAFDAQAPASSGGDGDSGGPSIGVTINGSSSSEVFISDSPQGAAVQLSIEVNEIEGKELFFVLNAPALGINWSYLNAKNQWLAVPANWAAIQPFALAPANGRHSLFGTQTLPPGSYEFYLGFDESVDGHLNIVGGGISGKFVQRTVHVQ